MAPLDMSIVKSALPVAAVVTAGVSWAPLSAAVLMTVLDAPPELELPHPASKNAAEPKTTTGQ
jgi:hypothetical protein